MIVFDLFCDADHRFEGWFSSSDDYDRQVEQGLVSCPHCGSMAVAKAPMAPSLTLKGNQTRVGRSSADQEQAGTDAGANAPAGPSMDIRTEQQVLTRGELPPEVSAALENLAKAQEKALKSSKWVGSDFAEQSRAMHYGERDAEVIHGKASVEEAEELMEEGICVAPLPFPIASPEDVN